MITHNGRVYLGAKTAQQAGVPQNAIAEALRAAANMAMRATVEDYRRRLSALEAGVSDPTPERVALWAVKARIARAHLNDPEATPDIFKTQLEREAQANGIDLAELYRRIVKKADAYEGLGLMIDAMQAEAKAGLAALEEAELMRDGGAAFLASLKAQADEAFQSAAAQIAA